MNDQADNQEIIAYFEKVDNFLLSWCNKTSREQDIPHIQLCKKRGLPPFDAAYTLIGELRKV